MWKTIKWVIGLALVGGIGWVGYQWYNSERHLPEGALSLIPPDAVFCIAASNPINTWREVAGSGTWRHLQGNTYFASLTASANGLDSLIRDNDLLSSLIGSRSLIVSAHMTGLKRYDFLFLVDLKQVAGIKFVNDYFSHYTTEGFSVVKEKYNEHDLITIRDSRKNTNLYVSFPGTFLAASYNRKTLLSSLNTARDTTSLTDNFIKEAGVITGDGLMQLYVNYTMLPRFVSAYSNEGKEYVGRLAETLKTTALTLTFEEEMMRASGRTSINDSVESYIKTLAISGAGPTQFTDIAPQRTGFALSFGFSSFAEFFANFENNLKQDVSEYNAYRENLRQAEEYLEIDLQENFISWIGDEVALLELQSAGKGIDQQTTLVLKASNIEIAKQNLAHIEKMVRRKTPVKFKAVEHRGYQINYLSMKGLFRMLLGKFFARFDKPYYTVVGNFVVFSNHPQTLKSMIDDYLDEKTLSASDEFMKFRNGFRDEGAVFIYVNTPVMYQTMKSLADKETRVSIEKNKEYITSFRHIGFQLVPDNNGFETLLAEQFIAPDTISMIADNSIPTTDIIPETETAVPVKAIVEEEHESDPMELPYIYARNLNVTEFTGYFADSTVQFIVALKNGFKDGAFTEYYENGRVKMKGHFKNDKRDGVWRLFDEKGELILKRTYDKDQITKEKD